MLEFPVSKYTICWKFGLDYIKQIWYNISVLRESELPSDPVFFLSSSLCFSIGHRLIFLLCFDMIWIWID